jgi:hypothetical protein
MALAYVPPGVSVQEVTSPSVNSSITPSNNVCVIGLAQGYQLETQQITVTSGEGAFNVTVLVSGETIQPVSASQVFVSVTNAINPVLGAGANQSGYAQGLDFTATLNATSTSVTVSGIVNSQFEQGGIINFTYEVVPANYFIPLRFYTQASVENTYGPAFNTQGIQTPISAGAYFAFEGGAQSVICQPLFVLENASDPTSTRLQPTGAQPAQVTTWQQTEYSLRSVPNLNWIVPIIGQGMPNVNDATQLSILETVQDHIYYMQTQENQFIFMVVGGDSSTSSSYATDVTLQAQVQSLAARYGNAVTENIIFIAPSSAQRPLPTQMNVVLTGGGEYISATLAGLFSNSAANTGFTHQIVPGWQNIPSYRDTSTKNADAQAGLMVLENNPTLPGTIIIRHAITADNSAIDRRALNAVRAKFVMVGSVTNVLNSQIIGQIPANGQAPALVAMAVTQTLQSLVGTGVIVSYTGVQASLVPNDPTTCQVAFSWLPAFPLDYIDVIFSLNLTNGNVPISVATGNAP